jgi:hypothetical protein
MLSSKQSLLNLYSVLLNGRKAKLVEEWQAQKANYKMVEVQNIFFQCSIDVDMSYADHPWADDHFHERVGGEATNPGRTFTYWPYYKDDDKHRPGEMFSHTYQERFWPLSKDSNSALRVAKLSFLSGILKTKACNQYDGYPVR